MKMHSPIVSNKPVETRRRDTFMKWQCRVRQILMREKAGEPDDSIMPSLTLKGESKPLGHVITVMSKAAAYSKLPELVHMVKRTNDPKQRREKALQLFSETYYQKHDEFDDTLTASFPPGSLGAMKIHKAGQCTLTFEQYNQRFDLNCKVWWLAQEDPLYQATWWHNNLFNPKLHPDAVILGFKPDWDASTSSEDIVRR